MKERDELVTEVIDTYAEPESFPRIEVSWEAERLLKLIDDAVADERRRIREAIDAKQEQFDKENRDMMGGMDLESAGILLGLSMAWEIVEDLS